MVLPDDVLDGKLTDDYLYGSVPLQEKEGPATSIDASCEECSAKDSLLDTDIDWKHIGSHCAFAPLQAAIQKTKPQTASIPEWGRNKGCGR